MIKDLLLHDLFLLKSLVVIATIISFSVLIILNSILRKEEEDSPFLSILALIFVFMLVTSCKSEAPKEPEQIIEVKGVGSTNFGRVPLGETRVAGVLIENKTKVSKSVPTIMMLPPFAINNSATTCGSTLDSGKSCILAVNFAPTARETYEETIVIFDKPIVFRGQGTNAGVLTVSPSLWNLPTKVAGYPETLTFTLGNDGDQRIPVPVITNVNDFEITGTNCASEILPGVSCYINVKFQRTTTGSYIETMRLVSGSVYVDIPTTVTVTPSNPDGIILFSGVPTTIVSDGLDTHTINITLVPDIYGNPVTDGTQVNLSSVNCDLIDGSTAITANGQSTFRIRSTTTRGSCTVSAFTGNAYGQFIIKAASDKASGVITVASFNNAIRATGTSSVTIRTNNVTDINGNAINDGDLIYFELTGPGTLDKTSAPSYQGQATVKVTSPTGAGSATLKIRSNPIYTGAVITSWGAESADITINYIAGFPSGTFPISCDRTNIYKQSSVDSYLSTRDSTICTIGPIRDTNNNNVGSGVNVDVSLINGLNKDNGLNNFTIQTNSSSNAVFELEGVGTRGDISIEAVVAATSVSHTVFATDDDVNYYLPFYDRMRIYTGYGSAITNLTSELIYPKTFSNSKIQRYYGDLSALYANDTVHTGMITYSGEPIELSYNFPYLTDTDCIQSIDLVTQIMPCFYYLKSGSTFYWDTSDLYSIGHDQDLTILRNRNLDYELGATTIHGSYTNILGYKFYNKSLDSFLNFGGISYSGSSSFTTSEISKISKISYPSSVLTQFDQLSLVSDSLSGLNTLMSSSVNMANGSTLVFGGMNYSKTDSNDTYRIYKDDNENLSVGVESLSIGDDPTYGEIPSLVNAGLYYEESESTLYVIGGARIVSGNLVHNDQIWRAVIGAPSNWQRVCDSCGLPAISYTNLNTQLDFPYSVSSATSTKFESVIDEIKKYTIQKSNNGDVILHITSGSFYTLNLNNGSTTLLSDNSKIAGLSSSQMFNINPNSGRAYSFSRGSKIAGDSKLRFFETEKGTKKYYIGEFDLPSGSKNTVMKINTVISGYGWAKDTSGTTDYGLSSYIFNFDTNAWEYLGTINSTSEADTLNDTQTYTKNETSNVSDYVSSGHKVYIMVTVDGTPGCYTNVSCPLTGESIIRLNYLEINGVW